ncbi:MAG TPA: ParB N-terminal domain-containing protein [Trebonia sp.]|nr:ParB N-terminal domain-containing protein [Trebonia sp.]
MTAPAVTPLGPVTVMPLANLRPYPKNARRINAKAVDQTAKSIKAFGWQQPIVADPDLVIIAGHVRWQAARQLSETEVPVVVAANLTPEQVKAFRIADNRTHDYTMWDYALLAAELDGIGAEFEGVLDLADWQEIIDGYAASPPEGEPLDDDPETAALLGAGFTLTLVFASRREAEEAGPVVLAKIPGVLNVRYGHKH